jgi:hypothetical protein
MLLKLKYLFSITCMIFLFTACSKEYSYENGGVLNGGTSIYTLAGAPGACESDSVGGTYKAGTVLNNSNVVVVIVNVDSIGTYSISTNNSDGISFNGSGIFAAIGTQAITLTGTGTPSAAGTFNFVPGTNGCSFSITVAAGDTTTDTTTTEDCKSCTYLPLCVGSTYTYSTGSTTTTADYLSVTDTTFDGAVYKKVTEASGNSYINCDNGVVTVVAFNITSVNGTTTLAELKQILLEANAAVGTTWTQTIVNGYGEPDTYDYTIAEKGISRTVLGVTFSNVIHVSSVVSVAVSGITDTTNTTDYYYASGIGLIESDLSDYATGTLESQQLLQSYNIP